MFTGGAIVIIVIQLFKSGSIGATGAIDGSRDTAGILKESSSVLGSDGPCGGSKVARPSGSMIIGLLGSRVLVGFSLPGRLRWGILVGTK